MGYATEVTESYWTVCYKDVSVPCGIKWCSGWLGIPYPCGTKWCTVSVPYPCKKYRTVTKYCYSFSSVKDKCWGVYETHYGCENGHEYKWTDKCFGWFTAYRSFVQICFDDPLEDLGPCRGGYSLPHGDVPHDPQLQDGVAIGGVQQQPLQSVDGDQAQTSAETRPESAKFAPPMHVREFCLTCFVGKIIIAIAALYGLYCAIRLVV